MAIGFARLEVVKRSSGKNACAKAAYNLRGIIQFSGTEHQPNQIYNWSHLEKSVFHQVLLPDHVNRKFLNPDFLWNAVEQRETRINSQVALDLVLALPDDSVITDEMRFELAKSFVKKYFIDKGVACQIDVHRPDNGHNWHAHVLITTRYFSADGNELGTKARDLLPSVRGGYVFSDKQYHKYWVNHLNESFEAKGLSLRVDEFAIIPQEHGGPVRMRGQAHSVLEKIQMNLKMNEKASLDPALILDHITQTKSTFTVEDIEKYVSKYVSPEQSYQVRKGIWESKDIIPLLDPKTEKQIGKYTTTVVRDEEKQIIRLADRLYQNATGLSVEDSFKFSLKLTEEQRRAFEGILSGQKLSCIDGHAGTGKSFLLSAIKDKFEAGGYKVRAFGPDNATAKVLETKGFEGAENIYSFLFKQYNEKGPNLKVKKFQKMPSIKNAIKEFTDLSKKASIAKGKEVWIIDESGKLGNKPLLELLKYAEKNNVHLIFSGSNSQLPSIERGGMFKVFCEKYGSHLLEDIQRQRDLTQRDIAKKLATGKITDAIFSIVTAGRLQWASNETEAMSCLIKKYTTDYLESKNTSSLIIATTNSEVRVLNEFVRQFRRSLGEISDREFLCETAYGKIGISVGDSFEFRENNSELGVTNGMRGILIEAKKDEFKVSINDQGKQRTVTFDPTTYTKFQLGYATTNYKSQGATTDRSYVLLSKYLNKESFYVGATRQTSDMHIFVSKSEFKNLSELKTKALKSGAKETSSIYITAEEIENTKIIEEKNQKIQSLKTDSKLSNKVLGYGLDTWESVMSLAQSTKERFEDRSLNERFFKPDLMKDAFRKGVVVEIEKNENLNSTNSSTSPARKEIESAKSSDKTNSESRTDKFSEEIKTLLQDYRMSWNKAAEVHSAIREGTKDTSILKQQWNAACVKRNEIASQLMKTMSKDELRDVLGVQGFQILFERAARHEMKEYKKEIVSENLDDQLKNNIDALLFRLFPDGPTRKDRTGLRFGSKGSLSVALRGKNAGSYHNFETGDSGGMLGLIMKTQGIDFGSAKDWAREFLGQPNNLTVPKAYLPSKPMNDYKEWISLQPPVNSKAPSLKELSPNLNAKYHEVARHSYTDEKGNPLFYVLRLQDKDKPAEKSIFPLSFGHWHGESNSPRWWLKGYQITDKKPLYNLEQLKQNTEATILVVEGEKTADAAKEMFKDQKIVCTTWSGGAEAVSKSNWYPTAGRKVIIWPDNDKAGYDAANALCSELRLAGAKEVRMVDNRVLAKELPSKWDLADPLPEDKNIKFIQDLMITAKNQTVDEDQFMLTFFRDKNISIADQLQAKFVLRLTEDRLMDKLLSDKLQPREAQDRIFKEAYNILNSREQITKTLRENGYSGDVCERLTKFSLSYQGKIGEMPHLSNLERAAEMLKEFGKNYPQIHLELSKEGISDSCIDHSIDRALTTISLNAEINAKEISREMQKQFRNEVYSYSKASNVRTVESPQKDSNIVKNHSLERSR